ncbi:MAG: S8 family serine peptidase [Dorea sp.]|nr:S8 family serine peptidase [Dorea sp.]
MKKYKKAAAYFTMLAMFLSSTKVEVKATEESEVIQIKDCLEISDIVNDNWEEDFFVQKTLDNSSEEVEEFLDGQEDDTIYKFEEKDNEIEVTAPYQTKRLIVESADLYEFYGAETVYYNEKMNETYLQFATEEDTKNAYEQLIARYGEGFCFVDEVFCIDEAICDADSENSYYSWGVGYMGMDVLKSQAEGRSDLSTVKVAVIDTGIDASNFMFEDRVITPDSYNIAAGNGNVKDEHGHGTHVSGTIVDATPDNVQIMSLKVGNSLGLSTTSFLRTAIQYAVENNANVVNISMGMFDTSGRPMTAYDTAIQAAYNKGIPICVAAGNDSVDAKYTYPACNPQTLTVSALGKSGKLATYSNRGNVIDFTAPGSGIVSACNGGTTVDMDGTSMAAPHITAAAAYMKMLKPDLTVEGVYNELKKYCLDLGDTGKDTLYGWGCPNLRSLFQNGIAGGVTGSGTGQDENNAANTASRQLGKPVLQTVSNVKSGIKIQWSGVKDCTGYSLYRRNGNGKYARIAALNRSATSYTDKKTADGKKYTYAVNACLNKDESAFSNEKQTIRISQPKITKIVKKSKKSKKSITVKWSKKKGVSGYQIQYSKKKNFSRAKTKRLSGKKISAGLKKLPKGKYYIRVRAWSKGGTGKVYSSWSSSKHVRII